MKSVVEKTAATSQTSSPSENLYLTPWENTGFAKKQRLCLLLNDDKTMRVQVIVKNKLAKISTFFTNLVNKEKKKNPSIIIQEKIFKHISKERFLKEKDKLQQLIKNRTSIKDLLNVLETDLSTHDQPAGVVNALPFTPIEELTKQVQFLQETISALTKKMSQPEEILPEPQPLPTLDSNEIAQRQLTIEELKQHLLNLLTEIELQENHPQLAHFTRLEAIVQRVKAATSDSLNHIKVLENDVENPYFSSPALKTTADLIKSDAERWEKELADVRQAMVEERFLETKAQAILPKIQMFSPEIQATWQKDLGQWEQKAIQEVSSLDQVKKSRSKQLEDLLQGLSQTCKNTILQTIEHSRNHYKSQLEAGLTSPLEKAAGLTDSQAAMDSFITHVLTSSLQIWDNLKRQQATLGNDLEAIAQWKQRVEEAQFLNSNLLNLLILNPENLPGKYPYLSYLTKPLKSIWEVGFQFFVPKPAPDEFTLVHQHDKEVDSRLLYICSALSAIGKALLQQISLKEEKYFLEEFNKLEKKKSISLTALQTLVNHFLPEIHSWVKMQPDPSTTLAVQKEGQKIANLLQVMQIFLEARKAARHHLMDKLVKQHDQLSKLSTHPSIKFPAQAKLEKLRTEEEWEETHLFSELKKNSDRWQQATQRCQELILHLTELAPLQGGFFAQANKVKTQLDFLTGEEQQIATEQLAELNQTLDLQTYLTDENVIDSHFFGNYHAILSNQAAEIKQTYEKENQKRRLRKEISKEIQTFLSKVTSYRTQVTEIEKKFEVKLTPFHDILDEKNEEAKEWMTKGKIPSYFSAYLPFLSSESEELKVENLNLDTLMLYKETVVSVMNQKANFLQSKSHIPQCVNAYKAFNDDLAEVNQAKLKFNADNQLSHAVKLDQKLGHIAQELQETLNSITRPNELVTAFKASADQLKDLQAQAKTFTTLKFLEQMKLLEGDKEKEDKLRQLFLAAFTTRIKDYQAKLESSLNTLKSIPELQQQAAQMTKDFSEGLKFHLEAFHSQGWLSSENISIAELNYSELAQYEKAIDQLINHGDKALSKLTNVHAKLTNAQTRFSNALKSAKTKSEELDSFDQILLNEQLKRVLTRVNLENSSYPHAVKLEDLSWQEWGEDLKDWAANGFNLNPSRLFDFRYKIYSHTDPLARPLKDYTKQVGKWIGKIEAAVSRANTAGRASLAEQLHEAAESWIGTRYAGSVLDEIYKRHKNKVKDHLKSSETQLTHYKTLLENSLNDNLHPNFYNEIVDAISKKTDEISALKKGFQTHSWWLSKITFGHLPFIKEVEKLSSRQLAAHLNFVQELKRNYLNELEKQYPLRKILALESQFTAAQTEAKRNALIIRNGTHSKVGQLYTAYVLDLAIDEIETKKKEQWNGTIRFVEDLEKFGAALHGWTIESKKAVALAEKTKKKPYTAQEQIELFLKDDKKPSQVSQKLKEESLLTLRNKIIDEVDAEIQSYRTTLNTYELSVEEISLDFDVPKRLKKGIKELIDKQQLKLDQHISGFQVTRMNWLGKPSVQQLKVEKMSNEEIVKIKPEKLIRDLGVKGLSSISQTPFGALVTQFKNFRTALTKAKEVKEALFNDIKYVQAVALETALEKIEQKLKDGSISITTDAELLTLADQMNGYLKEIQTAQKTAERAPKLPVSEQLTLLKDNPIATKKLKEHFIEEVRKEITAQQAKLTVFISDLSVLGQEIGLPLAWQSKLIQHIDIFNQKFEDFSLGIQVPITSIFGKTDFILKPFSELSATEIDACKKNVQALAKEVTALDQTYALSLLVKKSKTFNEERDKAKVIEDTLRKNNQSQIADDLAKEITTFEEEFSEQTSLLFQQEIESIGNYPTEIKKLTQLVDESTTRLMKILEDFRGKKPISLEQRILKLDATSEAYRNLREHLIEEMREKLKTCSEAIEKCKAKIIKLNEDILEISNKRFTVPATWQTLIQDAIQDLQNQILNYRKEFKDPVSKKTYELEALGLPIDPPHSIETILDNEADLIKYQLIQPSEFYKIDCLLKYQELTAAEFSTLKDFLNFRLSTENSITSQQIANLQGPNLVQYQLSNPKNFKLSLRSLITAEDKLPLIDQAIYKVINLENLHSLALNSSKYTFKTEDLVSQETLTKHPEELLNAPLSLETLIQHQFLKKEQIAEIGFFLKLQELLDYQLNEEPARAPRGPGAGALDISAATINKPLKSLGDLARLENPKKILAYQILCAQPTLLEGVNFNSSTYQIAASELLPAENIFQFPVDKVSKLRPEDLIRLQLISIEELQALRALFRYKTLSNFFYSIVDTEDQSRKDKLAKTSYDHLLVLNPEEFAEIKAEDLAIIKQLNIEEFSELKEMIRFEKMYPHLLTDNEIKRLSSAELRRCLILKPENFNAKIELLLKDASKIKDGVDYFDLLTYKILKWEDLIGLDLRDPRYQIPEKDLLAPSLFFSLLPVETLLEKKPEDLLHYQLIKPKELTRLIQMVKVKGILERLSTAKEAYASLTPEQFMQLSPEALLKMSSEDLIKFSNQLAKCQLLKYEELVRENAEDKKATGELNESFLGVKFEQATRLQQLVEGLKAFKEVLETSQSYTTKNTTTDLLKERQRDLKFLQDCQKDLVVHAVKNLRFAPDSRECLKTIKEATTLLGAANKNYFAGRGEIPLDAWSALRKLEINQETNPLTPGHSDKFEAEKSKIYDGYSFNYTEAVKNYGGYINEEARVSTRRGIQQNIKTVTTWIEHQSKALVDLEAAASFGGVNPAVPAEGQPAIAPEPPSQVHLENIKTLKSFLEKYAKFFDELDKHHEIDFRNEEELKMIKSIESIDHLHTSEELLIFRDKIQELCQFFRHEAEKSWIEICGTNKIFDHMSPYPEIIEWI